MFSSWKSLLPQSLCCDACWAYLSAEDVSRTLDYFVSYGRCASAERRSRDGANVVSIYNRVGEPFTASGGGWRSPLGQPIVDHRTVGWRPSKTTIECNTAPRYTSFDVWSHSASHFSHINTYNQSKHAPFAAAVIVQAVLASATLVATPAVCRNRWV